MTPEKRYSAIIEKNNSFCQQKEKRTELYFNPVGDISKNTKALT